MYLADQQYEADQWYDHWTFHLTRDLGTLALSESCLDILSRMTLERETKSAADDDVLPILNISAEMEE